MKRIENDCVCCDLPCVDCGAKRTPHWYCDRCKAEFDADELYDYYDEELCVDCLLENFADEWE